MNKKWKTAAVVFLCLIAVSSVSFSAVTLARVRKLEDNLSAVQHSVTSIDSDINSTLNSAITTITQTAEKSASIVSDYKVIWGECSQQNQTMEMTVRIMPKEFDDQTQVRLRCTGHSAKDQGYDMVFDTEGFEERSVDAERVESGVYEAKMTIPLVDYVSLTVEMQDGTAIRQEKLQDQSAVWGLKLLHPQMEGGFESFEVGSADKSSIDYTAYAKVSLMTSYDAGGASNGPEMTGASISLYLNGDEVETRQLGQSDEQTESEQQETSVQKEVQPDGSVLKVYSSNNTEYPNTWQGTLGGLKEGDVVSFVMRVQDENGFTYEQEVSRTPFTVKDGWIRSSDSGDAADSQILVK